MINITDWLQSARMTDYSHSLIIVQCRHVSFTVHLKICEPYEHQICGGKYAKITELYSQSSELSRHKLSPTLASAHYSCPDNAIGLVGRQLEAVGWKFSYYYQRLCRLNVTHNPHKLDTDLNRNTKNIKIIKIAIENANLCGKHAI